MAGSPTFCLKDSSRLCGVDPGDTYRHGERDLFSYFCLAKPQKVGQSRFFVSFNFLQSIELIHVKQWLPTATITIILLQLDPLIACHAAWPLPPFNSDVTDRCAQAKNSLDAVQSGGGNTPQYETCFKISTDVAEICMFYIFSEC